MGKLVVLNLGEQIREENLSKGVFPVMLQIGDEGERPSTQINGSLPASAKLEEDYLSWKQIYYAFGGLKLRVGKPGAQIQNFSVAEVKAKADILVTTFNEWLASPAFSPIRETLLAKLRPSDEVRLILETSNMQIRQLPWHCWDFLKTHFSNAEIAFSAPEYDQVIASTPVKEQVRILAILGDNTGINLAQDQATLEKLPDAETIFIPQPSRQELTDGIWEQSGDILFFAGHSRTEGETGRLYLKPGESLTIGELKDGLKRAVKQGLQLAIFNSCDGLGLAQELADLNIPQIILMREPVPDKVAQEFLKYFLAAFAGGQSFYLAVQAARLKLQGLENTFPCASWLPVICQSPAQMQPTWKGLRGYRLPPEFEALIREKTRLFCGRQFVFDALAQFINTHKCGYFTVVGEAGMGKTAIAAKYVSDNQEICYFNILAEGRNRPELFLKSLRQQLRERYQLQNAQDDDLSALLTKVSAKLPPKTRLVIVVDALDEVEQELKPGENILYFPKHLPERVYFLLTRRPYTAETKRLATEVPMGELDLREDDYVLLNRQNVQEYIRLFLNEDPEHKEPLSQWIAKRQLSPDTFVEQVAIKSESNFMYLRYVLPAIAKGFYDNLTLEELPQGLQDYYQTHWLRMRMEDKSQELRVIILFILVEIGTPITKEMIADIAHSDDYIVETIFNELVEYVRSQNIEREQCYSIYHASFLRFLKDKRQLNSTRKLFQQVNQRIAAYLAKGVE